MGSKPVVDCGTIWPKRRLSHSQVAVCVLATCIALPIASRCEAFQKRPGKTNREPAVREARVYDLLTLSDKSQLRGVGLGKDAQHFYFAVRRAWMDQHDRAAKRRASALLAEEKLAYEQLRDRTEALIISEPNAPYQFLLTAERDRATRWLKDNQPPLSELVILSLPRRDIVRLELANRQYANLAWSAWQVGIENAESESLSVLKTRLEEQGIDTQGEPPDLGRRFQAMPQSDEEWHARLALVRYSRDAAIDFQGTTGMMLRVEENGKPVDVAKLLQQSLSNRSQNLLDELLNDRKPSSRTASGQSDWISSAADKLSDPKEDYFRVTQVNTDMLDASASIDSAFVVKLADGSWIPIWQWSQKVSATEVTPAAMRQLEQDPQIQSLRSLLAPLGIASDDVIEKSLKIGAATMQGQQQTNSRFELFRQRYQHQLNVPVLRWDIQP